MGWKIILHVHFLGKKTPVFVWAKWLVSERIQQQPDILCLPPPVAKGAGSSNRGAGGGLSDRRPPSPPDNKTTQRWTVWERNAWNPKEAFINGCFNWMIPNRYLGNVDSKVYTFSCLCHGNSKTFIFRGYNPYMGGFKTFIFHGFGVQGCLLYKFWKFCSSQTQTSEALLSARPCWSYEDSIPSGWPSWRDSGGHDGFM